jgi:site-specific recombinase XerD
MISEFSDSRYIQSNTMVRNIRNLDIEVTRLYNLAAEFEASTSSKSLIEIKNTFKWPLKENISKPNSINAKCNIPYKQSNK